MDSGTPALLMSAIYRSAPLLAAGMAARTLGTGRSLAGRALNKRDKVSEKAQALKQSVTGGGNTFTRDE